MLGAVIGDIVGSVYEWNNIKTKDFEFFKRECFFTDDSVLTLAIANAILECSGDYSKLHEKTITNMLKIGRNYPFCGYGGRFSTWMFSNDQTPYNSFGNGSAMRVSAVAWAANSLEQVKELSLIVTEVTHNHPEGIKGAEATAVCIYLARTGATKEEIKKMVEDNYYPLGFTIDEIRDTYKFNETCQDTVPQAIECFLEADSYEDTIRNAISLGGDSDTLGAIAGAIAEAYFGIPESMREEGALYLDKTLSSIVTRFEKKFGYKTSK